MSIKKDFFAPLALGLGATRRAAMLLLVMMLTAATAWATSISTINVGGTDYALYTGFTATAGTKSYANFVDGNTSTQWQVMKKLGENARDFAGGTEDPAYVEFHADAPIIPKGYVLTYDNSVNENWKPTSWALKAKLNENDDWTEIHSSNSSLGNGSRFEIACTNDNNNQYQYFRFEIYDVGSTMQSILNELQIYAQFTYTPVPARAATCTEYGLTNDGYLRSDGKYFSDETGTNELTVGNGLINKIAHNGVHHEASDSNIEYWQCSMCGKYFTDEACTHEVTADEVFKGIFGTLTAGTNGESGYYTLESQTYTLTEDVNTAGYIYVPEGVTATIDLAGHTIDRGLTSTVANGYVIKVAGTLTLTDSGTGGTVKGGMDSGFDHVSCVKVAGSAAFILQGGTLIGNTSYKYNNAVMGGNNTSITISGGKITGDARGIYSLGNITVSGGEISGNTIGIESLNYSISVSGNPVITNNTNANVTLDSSLTIAGELTVGANIGITKRGSIPTDNAPVTITSGYGTYNNNVLPSTYFSLDNDGQIQTSPVDYMTVVMGWNEDKTEIAVGTALYTVNFDMNGHGDAIDAVSLLSGYKLMKPEPTADGWYFFGWYTDDACTSQWNFNNAVTSNMTLHALWTQEAIYSFTLPEKMVIVSADHEAVGGKYPVGTVIKFKVSSADYVVDGDVSYGTNTLTPDGDGIYTVTMGDADITITATIKKAVEPNKTLSGSESYTANDGDVLTGSTSGTVTIANNATITLSDVTITGGIVCENSAEITLVGTNSVTGAENKAGIQIGGSGTTLTIKGNGSLTANGGNQSAGIGLSRAWNPDDNVICGDIIIEGGNITANGGSQWGAGIGTGVIYGNGSAKTARIGNITIKGGSVKATGGSEADGIGTGFTYYGCTNTIGTVTIYDGIDKVDASSIKNSGSIVYKHEENDVTASKSDYFTIIENGNRRIIMQKVTPTIADVPDQTYTGSAITPEPTVIAGSLSLTKGTDYVYSYTNNTNFGTATVRATFQGTYASLGYVEKEFTILPSTVMVSVTGSGTVTCGDRSATDGTSFGVMSEKGASVVLTLAPTDGYAARSVAYGYTNNSGETASGIKLPISGTTATLTVPDDLKDGTGVTVTVTFAPALNGGADEALAVALTDATVTDLGGGWYKVENDISFDHTLNLLADTYLTIAEGKTMSVNTTSGKAIDSEYTLNVSGEGALNIATTEAYKIAVRVGNYVQTGATVTASGYIGIRCTDSFGTLGFDNDFTFSGGQLTATGSGGDGIWADNDITLSCTNATDFIQASSYDASSYDASGTVKVAEGNALTDGTEASNGMNGYSGTLTDEQITAIGGKTLHRAVTTSYVDASGTLHENVIAIPLDNTMTTLAAGWYVVNSDVDYTGTVTLSGNVKLTLSGDVTLILGDGCTMSFGKEGELLNATIMECNNHNLTIYGQSGGTGWLKAYSAQYDGIKNVNYYTQNSGNVLISDGNGACIKAGEFTILGGTLDLKDVGGANGEIVTTENINIRGGKLWAWYTGLKTNGKIILDYTNATDQIRAYSYQFQNGLEIADGKTLVDENGTIWSGTLEVVHQIGFNNSTLRPFKTITLADNADNSSTISEWNGGVAEVTLSGRTLYKDGAWNTLCLPFSLSAEQIAANTDFAGATLMTMDVTKKNGFDVEDGTLYLWFKTATTIEAGVPYLVKWEKAADYEGNEANYDISNPVFESVTISNSTAQAVESSTEGLETVQMVGTYSPVSVTANDKSILFLGDANTLYYSTVDRQIRSCRAYFSVPYINGHAEAKARAFALSFDGEETTGILEVSANYNGVTDEAWYSLDGVRLSGKPTQRGMYINKGKKILVK